MDEISPHGVPTTYRLRFRGQGGEIWWLFFKNLILEVITLEIWSFWGKVAVRRYMYQRTSLGGAAFVYTGTGGELFRGGIKVLAFYLVYLGLKFLLSLKAGPSASMAATVLLYAIIFAVTPFAMCSSRRYRLSRTRWRNIRFYFGGTTADCYRIFMPGIVLTLLTLGLYYPIWHAGMRAYWLNNTWYGDQRFHYDGEGVDLFGPYFISWLLLIPTLGFSRFRYKAAEMRYDAERTTIAGGRFHSTVTGMGLFGIAWRMLVFSVITLGFAYPWMLVRALEYYTSRLFFTGDADFDNVGIGERMPELSASGDEFSGFFDIDMDFGVGLRP